MQRVRTTDVPVNAEAEAQRLIESVWRSISGGQTIPVDPILISRELGIEVFDGKMQSSVSGMLVKESGRDPRILLNREDSPNRARFTCAHELGHYLRRAGNDDKFEYVDYRGPLSGAGQDPEEVFANQFAAALLMPEDEVRDRLDQGASVGELAWQFKVSADAMTYRLRNLGQT
jgi:Zn-dependent peptidase ImmA (M78 family)